MPPSYPATTTSFTASKARLQRTCMNASIWETTSAILLSLGGGGAIVLTLSSYLGRIWATRLMQRERLTHDRELAGLRADLERRNAKEVERLRDTLDLGRQVQYHQFSDKLTIYRGFVDIVAQLIVELEIAKQGAPRLPEQEVNFEIQRLRAYGYVAMLARQPVMEKIDALMDYLLECSEDIKQFEFSTVRSLAYSMINEIRLDIGINREPVAYVGRR